MGLFNYDYKDTENKKIRIVIELVQEVHQQRLTLSKLQTGQTE